eukprot:10717217-Heterocapsa_arctica.AAC.1
MECRASSPRTSESSPSMRLRHMYWEEVAARVEGAKEDERDRKAQARLVQVDEIVTREGANIQQWEVDWDEAQMLE